MEYDGPSHKCILSQSPIKVDYIHSEWAFDIKVSNDNTKFVKQVTVHVRADSNPEEAQKLADKLYKDALGS